MIPSSELQISNGSVKRLVIQIPCLNEEETIGLTIKELPRKITGIDQIEILVIDDGSEDGTARVALDAGAQHVISHTRNRGLAAAYLSGLEQALRLGADIIVNTDADNQYRGSDIEHLIQPILRGEADIVIGSRPIDQIEHFSMTKKLLHRFGSFVVRWITGTSVIDATSGFRAVSREAARHLFVYNRYTYTIETIIQASQQNLKIASVPIGTNKDLRRSRLIQSIPQYLMWSILTILRVYIIYRPIRFFALLMLVSGLPGLVLVGRFLVFYAMGHFGYIQSLQIGTGLIVISLLFLVGGVLADLSAMNRRLIEDLKTKVSRLEDRLGQI
jgi:glycosyltransferase involved in cell wall biosynthesis